MKPFHRLPLHEGWSFRAVDPTVDLLHNIDDDAADWMPAQVPGTVYQDLIAAGRIPDPFVGTNETSVQWVADTDWCYRLDFELDPDRLAEAVDLVFEGLDTFARVWLNGVPVLESDNMFVPARVAVRQWLRRGANRIAIVFDSALRRGREREALFGRRHLWNGDASRLHVRKAQYHYGWDWGPVLLTAGPWKPVALESYALRVVELDSPVSIDDAGGRAQVVVRTVLAGPGLPAADTVVVHHRLHAPDGRLVGEARLPAAALTQATLVVEAPELWWPAGLGAQPLYRLVTTLEAESAGVASPLAHEERRLGLRRLRLVQEPVAGEAGRSFHFEVNGVPLFCGGANWIPDDSLLNRISPARYRERVGQAVQGHLNMLRVWGGGIYEDDAFYDACDELGVLVWQDFLFACGIYPAHAGFLRSVEAEAEAAVRRLRHRPSLAIWCGNNEDYAVAESIGLYGPQAGKAGFEARVIYEELLPRVCLALDPQRPYWPGSPYSPTATGVLATADPTVGDRHSWEVWHGQMLPYQQYLRVQGRFISEFGMQAHASQEVLDQAVPPAERFALSRTLTAHNKAGSAEAPDGHRRLAVYLADTLNVGPEWGDMVYATQFVQAEALRYAYQDFRSRWIGDGARAVGGALVWQLNDCWPAISWSIIDSGGVPKPAWYTVRRCLAPVAVSLRLQAGKARCNVLSARRTAGVALAHLRIFGLDGAQVADIEQTCAIPANGSQGFELPLPALPEAVLAELVLTEAGRGMVARDTAWSEPYRFYRLPDPDLRLGRQGDCLTLSASLPAKGVWLSAPGVRFSDNFLDLRPGETVQVEAQGLCEQAICVRSLDQRARTL
ncbi:beta-mannosidase [Eleftheria terrae]|uniref:beta-mannosidase n=1 Tax=Eleftheria terrae TaxID=1597781 RepID=UPI00263A4575|nr:glycoside hydrolase family 2 protein [Eleftheria terrae]WKB55845.1 hypothetical protein N7L95_27590 [Eleftheria terrae]